MSLSPIMILRIQCPSCSRQFKVGEELMGRMVECGACGDRFRFEQDVVVPDRQKFYPGDIKRPGIRGAGRAPKVSPGPVGFQPIQYETSSTAADVIPLSPQRKFALLVGSSVFVGSILLFVLGSEPGGMLQDIDRQKRLVIAAFLSLVGIGLLGWGTRSRKVGWFSGIVLAVIVLTLSALVPIHYTLDPEIVNSPIKPLPSYDRESGAAMRREKRLSAEEIMELIGYAPVKKAMATFTTADRDGSERVVALWIPEMEERFKFQIQKYLQRTLKTKERPSYLGRRDGALFVVGGIENTFDELQDVVSNFGVVDDIYPEIRLITMTLDSDRFLGVSPQLMERLTDREHQAFYVKNLQELSHIDIDRAKAAAVRLSTVEPKRFRKEVTNQLVILIQSDLGAEYQDAFVQALGVWSEPEDGTDVAVVRGLNSLMKAQDTVPKSMIDFLVARKSPSVSSVLEVLWSEDPQSWETSMISLGESSQDAALRKLGSEDRGLLFSAIRILDRVGTKSSLPAMKAALAQADSEEIQSKLESAINAIESRDA